MRTPVWTLAAVLGLALAIAVAPPIFAEEGEGSDGETAPSGGSGDE